MPGPDAQLVRKVQQLQDQIINDAMRPKQQQDQIQDDIGAGTSSKMLHVLTVLQQSRLDAGRAAQIGVAASARSWSKVRKHAETALFRAVTVHFDDLEANLMKFWMRSECLYAKIYRLSQSLVLPLTIRANVRGDDQEISTSTCIGLSRGKGAAPYCSTPPYLKELAAMVLGGLKANLPQFTFHVASDQQGGVCQTAY